VLRNVYLKTMLDQKRSLLWWGIGMVLLAAFTVAFYPSMANAPGFDSLLEEMPEALARAFLGEVTDLTSPIGYLNSQLYVFFLPLLFLAFAAARGSSGIAGEEENGTLDLLLSYPVARWRVALDKFAAVITATLLLAFVFWLALALSAIAIGMEISLLRMAEATLSAALLGLTFGALALAVGCGTGKRALSIGVSGAAGTVAYFVNALMPLVEALEPSRKLSPFYYYNSADPLSNGLDPVHVLVLLVLTLVLVAVGLVLFNRRDLAV
jgi:ABC-2 type transport system permease protein